MALQGHGVLVAQRVRTSEWTLWNTQSSAATGTAPSWHLPAPGPLPEVANSDSAAAGRLPQEATSWPGVGSGPHNGSAGEGRPRRRSRWDAEAPICPEPAALDRTSGTAVPGSQAVPAGQQAPASGDWDSSSPQARRRSGHEREHRRHEVPSRGRRHTRASPGPAAARRHRHRYRHRSSLRLSSPVTSPRDTPEIPVHSWQPQCHTSADGPTNDRWQMWGSSEIEV